LDEDNREGHDSLAFLTEDQALNRAKQKKVIYLADPKIFG